MFLTEHSHVDASSRVGSFLLALFEQITETVRGMGGNRIIEFRDFMSRNQSMESAGLDRLGFYTDVVQRARKVR
jgi:hypothetical protein